MVIGYAIKSNNYVEPRKYSIYGVNIHNGGKKQQLLDASLTTYARSWNKMSYYNRDLEKDSFVSENCKYELI